MWSPSVNGGVLRRRYLYAPQLESYDVLAPRLHPWVALSAPRDVRGAVVSTDVQGFRRTRCTAGIIDSSSSVADGIVLGGSFSFGVGAESDADTLVSQLAGLTGLRLRNIGIRAATSTHEVIASMPFLEDGGPVVVCSGANNLIASLQTSQPRDVYGPLFFEQALAMVGSRSVNDVVDLVTGKQPAPVGVRGAIRGQLAGLARRAPAAAGPAAAAEIEPLSFGERRELALRRQLRDLSMLVRLVGDPSRITFCAQPFADTSTRGGVAQEQPLLGLHDRQLGVLWERVREYALAIWSRHVDELGVGVRNLGVRFLDLPAASFEGWSFVDRLHCRGEGYRQAATMICEVL